MSAAPDPRGFELAAITMGDRAPSSDPNCVARDDQRRRQLAALEFVCRRFDLIEDVVDEFSFVARRDDVFGRSFLLEIEFEDWIQQVIGRQRLIVKLSGR